jgi:putative endopeptidase
MFFSEEGAGQPRKNRKTSARVAIFRAMVVRLKAALFALAALLIIARAAPADAAEFGAWGLDFAGMDKSVPPGRDFFKYMNGTWDAKTPIPADRSSFGVDAVLADAAEREVRGILEAAPAGAAGAAQADGQKIHAAYQAFMDEARAQALGAAPIAADLNEIRSADTKVALAALMGRANEGFQPSIFRLEINGDSKLPDHYAVYVGQAGLGLPDRDYYLEPVFAAKKAAYQDYVARMLALAGWPEPQYSARALVDFETRIAQESWSIAEARDPVKTYNPMSPADLQAAAPGFPWLAFLNAAGLKDRARVVVEEKSAVLKIASIFEATPVSTLQAWAAFGVADAAAPYLDTQFDRAWFGFRGKLLQGEAEEKARWKRAVHVVNAGMGEAVGRFYVARYFPADAKAKIDSLVSELRVALGQRIDRLGWMAPETKARARTKLAKLRVKIAYPDKWRDYAALAVSATDPAGNARSFAAFEWHREVARLDLPVDRTEWGMTPQTVNAYYDPNQNEIVFPAAILAPPYFDPKADPAVNYGGIGGVIGHEMTHGFDDQGRQFDGDGKLTDWWTKEDAARFVASAKRLNAQYDTYAPFPGVHVKGDQTTGENIADLGGVLIALDAYHNSLQGKPAPVIDGLTGDPRFFLAYAQSWRDKETEDQERDYLVSDVHSPEVYRVNGVVRNVDSWYEAFGVKPGDALYLKPEDRVRIW